MMEQVINNSSMLPPAITHNPRHPPSAKDWEEQRATIQRLWSTEDKSLQEVMAVMEKGCGFRATYKAPCSTQHNVVCGMTNVDVEQSSTKRRLNVGVSRKMSRAMKWRP
jgi:hypothetical protein